MVISVVLTNNGLTFEHFIFIGIYFVLAIYFSISNVP